MLPVYNLFKVLFILVILSYFQVFKAIQKSSMDLLRVIERYQDRLCGELQTKVNSKCIIGRDESGSVSSFFEAFLFLMSIHDN